MHIWNFFWSQRWARAFDYMLYPTCALFEITNVTMPIKRLILSGTISENLNSDAA